MQSVKFYIMWAKFITDRSNHMPRSSIGRGRRRPFESLRGATRFFNHITARWVRACAHTLINNNLSRAVAGMALNRQLRGEFHQNSTSPPPSPFYFPHLLACTARFENDLLHTICTHLRRRRRRLGLMMATRRLLTQPLGERIHIRTINLFV